MFDNIYLRFKHDWPSFWVRLSVSAALCDGPINEKENQALQQFCRNVCANEPDRIWRAFSESPENPESIKNRTPKQHVRVLLVFLREIFRMMSADGTLNEKEIAWADRFRAASGLDNQLYVELAKVFIGREDEIGRAENILEVAPGSNLETVERAYRIKVKEYHPDKLHVVSDGVRSLAEEKLKSINGAYALLSSVKGISDKLPEFSVYTGDGWKLIDVMSPGEVVTCANCTQKNRLPGKHRFLVARCGECHGYLAWTVEQDNLFQIIMGKA